MSFDLFHPEIDQSSPRLERLFEQAKRDFWNDTTAIDWTQPLKLAPDEPLIRTVLEYVGRDEKKHTALAALYLPTILKQVGTVESHLLWAKQIYWTFCIAQAIWDHRRDANALGIDIQEGLRRGIAAQDHIVEQMGIRRGIFKSRTLEQLVISMYKPRQGEKWTRAQ